MTLMLILSQHIMVIKSKQIKSLHKTMFK